MKQFLQPFLPPHDLCPGSGKIHHSVWLSGEGKPPRTGAITQDFRTARAASPAVSVVIQTGLRTHVYRPQLSELLTRGDKSSVEQIVV